VLSLRKFGLWCRENKTTLKINGKIGLDRHLLNRYSSCSSPRTADWIEPKTKQPCTFNTAIFFPTGCNLTSQGYKQPLPHPHLKGLFAVTSYRLLMMCANAYHSARWWVCVTIKSTLMIFWRAGVRPPRFSPPPPLDTVAPSSTSPKPTLRNQNY
jgi:hypothetical protein